MKRSNFPISGLPDQRGMGFAAKEPVGTVPAVHLNAINTTSVIGDFFPSTKQQLKLVDDKHLQTEADLRAEIQELKTLFNDREARSSS